MEDSIGAKHDLATAGTTAAATVAGEVLQEQAAARAAQLLDNARNLRELKINETLVVALDCLLAQDNLLECPVPPTELRNHC